MKQDSIPVPVNQRHEFPWKYFRGEILEMQQDNTNALPLYAGGADNAPFAHSENTYTLDEDQDLDDLDGVEYDAIVVKDARIVHLTEVRLEGNKLVPVNRDENLNAEAGPLRSNDGRPEAFTSSSSERL